MKKFKIEDIKEHPINSILYKERDDVALSNSIIANGITKPPVVNQDGILIAGHRTVRAAKIAGIKEINCQVVKVRDENHHKLLLIMDNLCARGGTDLYPSEVAKSIDMVFNLGGIRHKSSKDKTATVATLTIEEFAKQIGVAPRTVRHYRTLANLIPELLDQLDKGKFRQSQALSIAKMSIENQKEVLDNPIELPPRKKKKPVVLDSSNNITTTKEKELEDKVLSLTVELENIQAKDLDKKIKYINKYGSDVQRQAVSYRKPEVVNKIYEVVQSNYTTTTKGMNPSFPPPINQMITPAVENKDYTELKQRFKALSEDYDKLLDKCMELEMTVPNGGQEPEKVKDYTQLHGSDITPEELDKVKLAFSDHDTYKRLMTEYQKEQNAN